MVLVMCSCLLFLVSVMYDVCVSAMYGVCVSAMYGVCVSAMYGVCVCVCVCVCVVSDESEDVERACQQLIANIEGTLGESLQQYLSPS